MSDGLWLCFLKPVHLYFNLLSIAKASLGNPSASACCGVQETSRARTPFPLESSLFIHIESNLGQVALIFQLAEYCLVFAMQQALTYDMAEADSQGTSSLRVLAPF